MAVRCFSEVHPNDSLKEAKKVRNLGEVQYNHVRLLQALAWIRSHPAQFRKLTAERAIVFWLAAETFTFPQGHTCGRKRERLVIYLMTALSLPGIYLLYRRDARSAAILGSCLFLFPLIYYIVQFEYRYRYPILWMTFLLGAVPLAILWEQTRNFASKLKQNADSQGNGERNSKLLSISRMSQQNGMREDVRRIVGPQKGWPVFFG